MSWQRKFMQVRDVFAMRAHYGWVHYLSRQVTRKTRITKPFNRWVDNRLSKYTDEKSAAFDRLHGTETFTRSVCAVSANVSVDKLSWGYGPINQDFFREIIRAVPVDLSRYTFVDVGAGKGTALMIASEFSFQRIIGVELSQELIDIGKLNIERYVNSTNNTLSPDWIRADFLTWPIVKEDSLFFFNNPLPGTIALQAVQRLEEEVAMQDARLIIAYRKAPSAVDKFLQDSPFFRPLRLAPYWRIYGSKRVSS